MKIPICIKSRCLLGLEENQKVDLKIVVVNEKGRKSVVYSSTVWRREPFAASELKNIEQGVNFRTYEQNLRWLDDIDKAAAVNSGQTKSLGLGQFKEKVAENLPFAVVYEGYINVPKDEIYEFELDADDGAILLIDDEKVVDNDGVKEKMERKNGFVPLKKGCHRFILKYFKGQGKSALGVRWGIKGQLLRGVSANELAYSKTQ